MVKIQIDRRLDKQILDMTFSMKRELISGSGKKV